MASLKQARGVGQLSDKEKAAIGEAMKEAQSVLAKNIDNAKVVSQDQLVLVTGVLKNLQFQGIRLSKIHEWKGQFMAEPPAIIDGKGSGAFVHQGAASQGNLPVVVGSKGAIIYSYADIVIPYLGWLLAWDKSHNSNEMNKVYVEAGYLAKLTKTEWSEIEQKLDASHSISRYWDSDTGAAAAAEIKDHGNNMALLGVTFDQFNEIPPPVLSIKDHVPLSTYYKCDPSALYIYQ